jgi:hypothetical protein
LLNQSIASKNTKKKKKQSKTRNQPKTKNLSKLSCWDKVTSSSYGNHLTQKSTILVGPKSSSTPTFSPKLEIRQTPLSPPPKKGLKKENEVWYQSAFFKNYRDQLTNSLKHEGQK